MKLSILLACILTFSILSDSAANPDNPITFLKVPYWEAVEMGKATQKPFFAYFSGDWCLGCQLMEASTFQDQALQTYISENIIAINVELQSELGKEWDEQFSISCMPTFLFFTPQGELIERYETTLTAAALQTILKSIRETGSSASLTPTPATASDQNLRVAELQKWMDDPAFNQVLNNHIRDLEALANNGHNPKEIASATLLEMDKTASDYLEDQQAANDTLDDNCRQFLSNETALSAMINHLKELESTQKSWTSIASPAATSVEALSSAPAPVVVEKAPAPAIRKTTHKVQLGVFQNYSFAQRLADKVEAATGHKVFFITETSNGKITHRVVAGGFDDREKAQAFVEAAKRKGYKAIVK